MALSLLGRTSAALAGEPEPAAMPPTSPRVGLHAIATRGTFATIAVSRVGILGELRGRRLPIGASLSFDGGLTDNGLGAHRAALGLDVRTPWPTLELCGGAHVAYAMLVRTTGNDNFMRALGGDIASFALGLHAGLEGHVPLGATRELAIGIRGLFELYDGAVGAMVGPELGLVF